MKHWHLTDWVVLAIAFLVLALSFSARSLLGLTMPTLETELGWTRSISSSAMSLALVVMGCVAPLSGALVDRFGARAILCAGLAAVGLGVALTAGISASWQFFVTFSLLAGLGFGMAANHVVATLMSRRFEEGRGLAAVTGPFGGGPTEVAVVGAKGGWQASA